LRLLDGIKEICNPNDLSNQSVGKSRMITSSSLIHKNLEILDLIGEGGSGAVYRAHQAILDREVAVKVIKASYANQPDFIRSFEQEAQFIARLEHPHIVPLYDYWRDPDGAYLVMRFLRGGSLKKRLERGALSLNEIDGLLDQLTSALAAAHRASVVHRDLKPDNILVDEDGNAYLSDFGIARITGHDPTQESVSGTLAYMAPEQLMSSPTSVTMDIYSLGIILFEMLTGRSPYSGFNAGQIILMQMNESLPDLQEFSPDLPFAINTIVKKATSKKPEERFASARELWRDFHRIVSKGDTARLDMEVTERRNPYKGLRPFDEADAGDFFGREAIIGQLLNRMTEGTPYHNFLAIVGASGSGKSSLVRAGLIPELRSGRIPGSNHWFISEMVPGSNPLTGLTQALLSVAPGAPPRLQEQLQSNSRALLWAVDNMMANVEGDLLLFIDQFEELFTQVQNEAERVQFLDLLSNAVSEENSRFRVIITLRADFYDRPLVYQGFGEIVQQRTQVVLPLNASEIERAITGPAHHVGMQVNSDLIAAIVDDMREEPGALPLLQYALTEVFERSDENVLTLEAYRERGGVVGALVRRAEDVYRSLTESEKDTVQQLFLRLVAIGEYGVDTRRRTMQSELISIAGVQRSEVDKVLTTFGDYRLLAFDRDPVTREPVIEIAHEALIRGWERLRHWLEESREDLRMQRQLASVASEWLGAQRDPSYLLRGTRLIQIKEWAQTATLSLATVERELLDASIREAEREEQVREAARLEKERLTARTQRQQRLLIAVLVVGFIITTVLGLLAMVQGNRARTEADQNATAQFVAVEQAAAAENARATSEANSAQLRRAIDEITSLNMADAAIQSLDNHDVDSAIALAFKANQIDQPPLQVRRSLSTVAGSVGTSRLLEGHDRDVQAIAFSPDGKKLVSGAYDRTLILWNVSDGSIIRQMEGHEDVVLTVAYSPDGRYIASGDASGVILLWDAATGEKVREFRGHSDNVQEVAFSPDGEQLASASADGSVILWDVESANVVYRLIGHDSAVLAVAFSPDDKLIASSALNGSLFLWDRETGQQKLALEKNASGINTVAFRPDGTQLISAGDDRIIKLWDVSTGSLVQAFNSGHTDNILSVAFSPDGKQVVSGSADKTLRLWDVASGRSIRVYIGHTGRVHSVAFSPDDAIIASGSADKTLRLWLTQYVPIGNALTLRGHNDDVKQAVFSPDGTTILSGAGTLFDTTPLDERMILWNWSTGTMLRTFAGHKDSITSVAFSPDGKRALSASRDTSLILWDVATGDIVRRFEGHTDWVWSVVFSPDGKQALSASRDASLILWDVATGDIVRRFEGHTDWVNAGVFSVDGREIVSGSDDGTVILWDTQTGQMIRQFKGHEGPVHDVAISPDGRLILSGSSDWSAIVWDANTGDILYQSFDQQGAVNSVAFSPDGKTMVTASADGTIIQWDVQTDERLLTFSAEGEIVRSTAFSPDGQWLLATFDSGLIRVYPLNQQVVMDWIAQHVYLRPFTCDERLKFAIEPLCSAGSS
jgi:WD40 repeat protein/serine/threonine protein kinase